MPTLASIESAIERCDLILACVAARLTRPTWTGRQRLLTELHKRRTHWRTNWWLALKARRQELGLPITGNGAMGPPAVPSQMDYLLRRIR